MLCEKHMLCIVFQFYYSEHPLVRSVQISEVPLIQIIVQCLQVYGFFRSFYGFLTTHTDAVFLYTEKQHA